jgi:adenylate cyclase
VLTLECRNNPFAAIGSRVIAVSWVVMGIERAFSKRNRTARQQIEVRIGLHTGELIHEDDDFYGRHVNFAARVASKAGAREILVSSLLRDVVEPSGEFSFEARKPEVLKGFTKKHTLHVARSADV